MNLYNHYKLNFDVTQYHKFNLSDIHDMIPFERELYVDMIIDKMNREKKEKSNNISLDSML